MRPTVSGKLAEPSRGERFCDPGRLEGVPSYTVDVAFKFLRKVISRSYVGTSGRRITTQKIVEVSLGELGKEETRQAAKASRVVGALPYFT